MVQLSYQQPKAPNPLGAALGQGISEGLNQKLEGMYEEKKYQKDLVRKRTENMQFYKSNRPLLEKYLSNEALDSLEKTGADPNLMPHIIKAEQEKAQIEAQRPYKEAQTRKLAADTAKSEAEAKAYQQFAGEPQNELAQGYENQPEVQNIFKNTKPNLGNTELENQPAQGQQGQGIVPEESQGIQPILPKKTKNIPPLGGLGQAAAIQSREYTQEVKRADAQTKEYRESTAKKAEGAVKARKTLGKMRQLKNSGKLTGPVLAKIATTTGLIGLLNPETQMFNKLTGEFLPTMSDIYGGGRVTNQHENFFMNTIPSILQTDTGKGLLIDVLDKQYEAEEIKDDIMKEILRETKGIPPLNLQEMVNDRAKESLDKNYQDTLDILKRGTMMNAPKGTIPMIDELGDLYYIPQNDVEKAKSQNLSEL